MERDVEEVLDQIWWKSARNRPGIEKFQRYLSFRFVTLHRAFEELARLPKKRVVELGTSRSFVNLRFPGVMSTDPKFWHVDEPWRWDWGAGIFTRMVSTHFEADHPEIHSVDLSPAAIEISRVMTRDLGSGVHLHCQTSESFLQSHDAPIDLLYMDTGECEPSAADLHLREAHLIVERDLIAPDGLILIDDIGADGPGPRPYPKGRLSIPFLEAHGFRIILAKYQVLMQRAGSGTVYSSHSV